METRINRKRWKKRERNAIMPSFAVFAYFIFFHLVRFFGFSKGISWTFIRNVQNPWKLRRNFRSFFVFGSFHVTKSYFHPKAMLVSCLIVFVCTWLLRGSNVAASSSFFFLSRLSRFIKQSKNFRDMVSSFSWEDESLYNLAVRYERVLPPHNHFFE